MKRFTLAITLWAVAAMLPCQASGQAAEMNVNARYTVESVTLSPDREDKLSEELREELRQTAGAKFDQAALDQLAERIRLELKARAVSQKVSRGAQPDTVKVIFHVESHTRGNELTASRLIYHSKQNWSFGADAVFKREDLRLSFGILTDGDELIERYSGLRGSFERSRIAGDVIGFKLSLETFRAQWNPATQVALERALEIPGIYRTRYHIQPGVTIAPLNGLKLQFGPSFQRFQTQFPVARREGAHAVEGSLQYEHRLEPLPTQTHEFKAGYSLRSATRSLDSDYVYTRHSAEASYTLKGRRETLIANFTAGALYGRAPLFERFVLGNSRTLRGWNKFDVDPLGGDRMAHGSLEYRYRGLRVLYDAGSNWRRGQDAKARHSLGAGFVHSKFSVLLAFPLKAEPVRPVLMLGIGF